MRMDKDPFQQGFESLEDLAETINDVLGCPVTIEDAHHRLVAYSSHDPHTDTARIATIVSRQVPKKVMEGLRREGAIQRLAESREPVRIAAIREIGLDNRVAIAIRKNADILGYIWAVEADKWLDDKGMQQLKKAAQAAGTKLIQLHLQRRKEEEGLQDFFWQLLMGQFQSETQIRERAEKLGAALPSAFYVLAVQFSSEMTERRAQQIRDMNEASGHLRIVCHVVDHDQLILLAAPKFLNRDAQEDARPIEYFMNMIKNRFGSTLVAGGSGSRCDKYMLTDNSYKEALTLLQIQKQFPDETGQLYQYADLGYYRFLPLLLEESRKNNVKNACLKRLREYDSKHNANLLQTLEVFLGQDSNAKDAADILHIHINTMNYRLKRISEIGDIDLTNMDQKVTLYLDLKTERLSGH